MGDPVYRLELRNVMADAECAITRYFGKLFLGQQLNSTGLSASVAGQQIETKGGKSIVGAAISSPRVCQHKVGTEQARRIV